MGRQTMYLLWCISISGIFEHPLNELKAVPRVDSQGQVCGATYKVDDKSKKDTGMPRVGSAANWSSQF
ncbi:hypothetical protein GW17_00035077 [Ensete ventricosum]|uniref:Uncharacterized protein n=1 Tax=Ensete ventricosum TaxID=4639 RepID=A0A426Z4B9_ENSVE|nr:hypothetical protein B296_00026509 [Ensete ventricosum]RWW01859.1 hypothetical protein GW17_00035077 [Ensete ventricosum]